MNTLSFVTSNTTVPNGSFAYFNGTNSFHYEWIFQKTTDKKELGTWLTVTKPDGTWKTKKISSTPVCPVSAIVDEKDQSYIKFLYRALGKQPKSTELIVSLGDIQSCGKKFVSTLIDHGVMLMERKEVNDFKQMMCDFYLTAFKQPTRYYRQGISRAGWHMIKNPDMQTSSLQYVAPGFSTTDHVVFVGPEIGSFKQIGDEQTYLTGMSKLLVNNPNILLIAGFHVAGLFKGLIPELKEVNPVWNIVSGTHTGKSDMAVALGALGSIFGVENVILDDYLTPGALDSRLQSMSDRGVIMHDGLFQRLSKENKAISLYNLASSKSRSHMVRSGLTGCYEPVVTTASRYTALIVSEQGLGIDQMSQGLLERVLELHFNQDSRPLWHNADLEFIWDNAGWLAPRLIETVRAKLSVYQAMYQHFMESLDASVPGTSTMELQGFALALTGVALLQKVLGKEHGFSIESVFEAEETAQSWIAQD